MSKMTPEHQNTEDALRAMYDGLIGHCRQLYPHKRYPEWHELTENDRVVIQYAQYDIMTFIGVLAEMRPKFPNDDALAARVLKQVIHKVAEETKA